jgi:hypothetical protein
MEMAVARWSYDITVRTKEAAVAPPRQGYHFLPASTAYETRTSHKQPKQKALSV